MKSGTLVTNRGSLQVTKSLTLRSASTTRCAQQNQPQQQSHFAAPFSIKPLRLAAFNGCTLRVVDGAPSPHRATRQQGSTPTTNTEVEDSGEYCLPAYVSVNNQANPNFTVLEVEVQDYPGLIRVLAWVLNGLDIVAQNAILRTGSDGVAHNTLWLSTRSGKKLKDNAAELLSERVRDFVAYCSPKPGHQTQTEFVAGPLKISNNEHSDYTVITVKETKRTPGFLLEITSVLSGLNIDVFQGIIQGCTDCGDDVPRVSEQEVASDYDDGARVFKFWVRGKQGEKLDYGAVSALIYTLSLALGFDYYPLTPVDQEMS